MKTKDFKHWLAINGIDSRDRHGTIIIEEFLQVDTQTGEVVFLDYLRVDTQDPFINTLMIIEKALEYAKTPVKER